MVRPSAMSSECLLMVTMKNREQVYPLPLYSNYGKQAAMRVTMATIATTDRVMPLKAYVSLHTVCRFLAPHQTIFTMFKCSTVAAVVIVEKASYGCVALHPHIHRMDTMQFFPTSVRRYKHKINKTLTTMYEWGKISLDYFSNSMRGLFSSSTSSDLPHRDYCYLDIVRSNASAQCELLSYCFQICRLSNCSNL